MNSAMDVKYDGRLPLCSVIMFVQTYFMSATWQNKYYSSCANIDLLC